MVLYRTSKLTPWIRISKIVIKGIKNQTAPMLQVPIKSSEYVVER